IRNSTGYPPRVSRDSAARACGRQFPLGINRFATEMAQPIFSVVGYGTGDQRARRAINRRAVLKGNTQSASLAAPTRTRERMRSERSAGDKRTNFRIVLCPIPDLYQTFCVELADKRKNVRFAAFALNVIFALDRIAYVGHPYR